MATTYTARVMTVLHTTKGHNSVFRKVDDCLAKDPSLRDDQVKGK